MATLSVQAYNESGTDLTMSAAAAGGDEFINTGNELLIIKNADVSAKTVTITAQMTSFAFGRSGKVVKQDQTLSVAAGGVGIMGPFPSTAFDDSDGKVQVTYSAVTSVTVAAVKNE